MPSLVLGRTIRKVRAVLLVLQQGDIVVVRLTRLLASVVFMAGGLNPPTPVLSSVASRMCTPPGTTLAGLEV